MLFQRRSKDKSRAFDFLCVGAQKAGTTWLWAALSQHPEIGLPLVKELQFFSKAHLGVYYKGLAERHEALARKRAANLRQNGRHKRAAIFEEIADGCSAPDEDWYRKVFRSIPASKVTGEFSPDYFCVGEAGVHHIKAMNSDARIIILVRDPLTRIRSSLSMVSGLDEIKPNMLNPQKLFLARGDYRTNIPIWDDAFGEKVLYIPFRDIASRATETLIDVCTHLGIKSDFGFEQTGKKRNSWSERASLSDDFLAPFQEHASAQRAFLSQRFSSDFCSRI